MTSKSKIKSYDLDYLWHPFTQMKEYGEDEPLVIEGSDGVYLIDSEGKRYIDGVSSLWVNIHGHKVKKIDAAIKKQIDKISHSTLLGVTNPPASILAKKLIDIAPKGLKKVFYSGDGASAVEVALKMAFQYWLLKDKPAKQKFLCLKDGNHGDTRLQKQIADLPKACADVALVSGNKASTVNINHGGCRLRRWHQESV